MVESGKEYVLQWSGHAAHVTERFSGLLARQALVDVTLICQGQKLRVHKLVLASCSLYFEEMLEQDLGQEPIILLRDLDFDVLKAMVEFMYCGETTISHCHLQTLLDAAQVFKVKELECIVNSMLGPEKNPESPSPEPEDSEGFISSSSDKKRCCSKLLPSGERFHDASMSSDLEEHTISERKADQTLENCTKNSYGEEDVEQSLYETTDLVSGMAVDCQEEEEEEEEEEPESSDNSSEATADISDSERSKMCTSSDDEEPLQPDDHKFVSSKGENDIKSTFIERFCDYSSGIAATDDNAKSVNDKNSLHSQFDYQDVPSGVGECSKVYTHKKRKYRERDDYSHESFSDSPTELSSVEDNIIDDSNECPRSENRHEKCLKVYTHKRRKSLDDKKHLSISSVSDSIKKPAGTSCIDLSDEGSRNNPPVTLPATLDMETSEYIWNMSSENIQYVVGCTMYQSNGVINSKEGKFSEGSVKIDLERSNNDSANNKRVRNIKELFSVNNRSLDITTPPVLRRSVRINQLENDDSINNNNNTNQNNNNNQTSLTTSKARDKNSDIKNDDYSSNNSTNKTKRKVNKETDSRVCDENKVTTTTTTTQSPLRKKKNISRSLRRTSKLTSGKSSGKTRCALARNDKDEQKTKNHGKVKKIESTECDFSPPTRLNTIASVDRALWGDMSDVLENRDYGASLVADYSPSKEIPFAVGLLPLRAALERMQATLDHQPRKTRSSVAPFKQDLYFLKRKDAETISASRKNGGSDNDVLAASNTVCHIQIRTSSQCTQNRRTSPSDQMAAVESTLESNRR